MALGTSGAKEFEAGRLRRAALTQKLPSPALKEAERPGSYNPGDLNTLTGGIVRQAPYKNAGGTSDARHAELIYANLRGYAQGKQGVFGTDAGDGRCAKRAGTGLITRSAQEPRG